MDNQKGLAMYKEIKNLLRLWQRRETFASSVIINNSSLLYECSKCLSVFRDQENFYDHFSHCSYYKSINNTTSNAKHMIFVNPTTVMIIVKSTGNLAAAPVNKMVQTTSTDFQEAVFEQNGDADETTLHVATDNNIPEQEPPKVDDKEKLNDTHNLVRMLNNNMQSINVASSNKKL